MKSENDMTDEELSEYEKLTAVVEDRLDRLELLRKSLNDSRVEQTYVIKRSSKLGPLCPYYLKAKRLLEQDQLKNLVDQMKALVKEFEDA